MDAILYLIYYIVIVWFLLTYSAIITCRVRYRRRPGRRATYVTGNTLRRAHISVGGGGHSSENAIRFWNP